ncbi:hypothetical protein B0O99DRAFT_588497 [Bisporella sp. PMI_857]|nr:hypothetical protein B0O99DRAFT_588497 [Bisporella sp. PMI_857]
MSQTFMVPPKRNRMAQTIGRCNRFHKVGLVNRTEVTILGDASNPAAQLYAGRRHKPLSLLTKEAPMKASLSKQTDISRLLAGKGNLSVDFVAESNKLISDTLTDYDLPNTDIQADILSIITIIELGSTKRLFDEKLLGHAASNMYSTVFVALAAVNRTDAGPVRETHSSLSPQTHELLSVIAESGETRDFKCLDGRRFAMGVFRGVLGARCIGIDFEEKVMKMGKNRNGLNGTREY